MVIAVVDTTTNQFREAGYAMPGSIPVNCISVVMPFDYIPNFITQRYDSTSATLIRPATQAELDAAASVAIDANAALEAKRKDLLAAWATVEEKFDPAWPTMTNLQRKQAVQALAQRYASWRAWIDRNL